MIDPFYLLCEMEGMHVSIAEKIELASRVVRSVAPALPNKAGMERELAEAESAEERGYFLPDEDERIREVFARYLNVRATLLESVESIQPVLEELGSMSASVNDKTLDELEKIRLRAFIIGFSAATMLVRAASFMVDLAGSRPVVAKKLDEAESRYGIEAKSYTQVYKNLGSTRRMWRFHESMTFYETNSEDIAELRDDAVVGELVALLEREGEFLQYRKRDYVKRKLDYRLHSFKRRHISGYNKVMFHLLKLSGSAIAEMKQPFVKPAGSGKRVTSDVIKTIHPLLKAGDIFITRHDDAMSNLFLPGFWPHAALYIGTQEERDALNVSLSEEDGRNLESYHFLEAKKDGVLFRPIKDTLHVDAFTILRPKLSSDQISEALNNALSHEGKLYDFMFDFSQSNRLACTALIYRSFHGVGDISLSLIEHAGRSCLSAEVLIKQALESGHFENFADYGVEEDSIRML